MKTKITICFTLMLTLVFSSLSVFAANSAIASKSFAEMTDTIKLLEIANGDENQNMNYDKFVTRAEFVKMAVSASPSKDEATNSKINVSLFPDVRNTYWGASYISVAIKGGLVNGFLDGTFRPNDNVKLEEAATIVLKLLGYTSSDFISPYPQGQLAKYKSLGLDTNISAKQGDNLTRLECMQILYNALSTPTKNGTVYCSTLGYKVGNDGVIDHKALIENKLKGPYIVSESGIDQIIEFNKESAVVYIDDKISDISKIRPFDCVYYNNEISTIWAYTDKTFGVIESLLPNAINPTSALIAGKTYSFNSNFSGVENLKTNLFVMLVFDRNKNIGAIVQADSEMYNKYHAPKTQSSSIADAALSEPVVFTDVKSLTSNAPFEISGSTKILFEDSLLQLSDLKSGDVCYFVPTFDSIVVYRKTATGIFDATKSGSSDNESLTLSGKKYLFGNTSVKNMFSSGGIYASGQNFVTLILGKNDVVIDAKDGNILLLEDNNNNPTLLDMIEETLSVPIHISSSKDLLSFTKDIPFDVSKASIYLNNTASSLDQLRLNDIVYYSKPFKSLWVYRYAVSGTIEEVTPAMSPQSVVVAGRTYKIASSKTSYDLSNFGTYKVGDFVTLLLGRDDAVAAIANSGDIYSELYGVVTALGTKDYKKADGTTYKADYITIITGDASVYTYQHKNRNFAVGDVVKVTLSESVSITKSYTDITSATATRVANAIKNGNFSDECRILDYHVSNPTRIYPSRIKGLDIEPGSFLFTGALMHYQFDEEGNISCLIFNNFTGDAEKYGFATTVTASGAEYISGDTEQTFKGEIGKSITSSPIKIRTNSFGEEILSNLTSYVDVDSITRFAVYDERGNEYLISDSVQVVIMTLSETVVEDKRYSACSVSDINEVSNGNYTLRAYYDKTPSSGGRIRVIVATAK